MHNCKFALRQLFRNPGFTCVAVLTLALGIGANTAIFSVVHGVLLRPLPYRNPERLVRIASVNPSAGLADSRSSGLNVLDWQRLAQSFEAIAAFQEWDGILTLKGRSHPARINWVTPNLLPLLGVQPVLGGLLPVDETAASRILLPHRLWQNEFGSDPGIIGKTVIEDGVPTTVVGVLPPSVAAPAQGALSLDQAFVRADLVGVNYPRDWQLFNVVGKLKPGVSLAAAQAELSGIARELERLYPETNRGWGVQVRDLKEWMVAPVRGQLWAVYAATGIILLIASLNVSNLLLIRGAARRRELAIRSALGSTRGQLLGPFLAESALLAAAGGVAGLFLAAATQGVLLRYAPEALGLRSSPPFSWAAFASVGGASIAAAFIFGLLPALRSSQGDLQKDLGNSGRSLSPERGRHRLLSGLVAGQIAISTVLLIAAGLALASFQKLTSVSPGFDPRNAVCFRVGVLPDRAAGERLLAAVSSVPGVEKAGGSHIEIFNDVFSNPVRITIDGDKRPEQASAPTVNFWLVTRDFFAAARIPVLAGRVFNEHDDTNAPWTAVINEAMAKRYFPGSDPIGKVIRIPDYKRKQPGRAREVVGVVGSVRQQGLRKPAVPILYSHYTDFETGSLAMIVRTFQNPAAVLPVLREAIQKVSSELVMTRVATAEQVVARSVAGDQFAALLMFVFAALGTLLGAIGLYGVLAYSVSQRTREIGIRMALGARKRVVLGQVLRQAFVLASAGIVVGMALAAGLGRFVQSLLFEVSPADPFVFVTIPVLLLAVTLLASWLPARRAASVNPIEALRCE